ncbi:hypothetical protein PSCLAVI8L_90124 [Pseudoclavibacter sp. 8L]|nr:hypothetical protein PSCLAVI8L_90124 [Pseudoclavibacter sp. 8L]
MRTLESIPMQRRPKIGRQNPVDTVRTPHLSLRTSITMVGLVNQIGSHWHSRSHSRSHSHTHSHPRTTTTATTGDDCDHGRHATRAAVASAFNAWSSTANSALRHNPKYPDPLENRVESSCSTPLVRSYP